MTFRLYWPFGLFGLASLAALSVLQALGSPSQGTPAASPISCGRPVSSWGAATANDVRVALLRLDVEPLAERGTPQPATEGQVVRADLELQHLGTLAAEIRLSEIALVDCAGHHYTPALSIGTPAPGTIPLPPSHAIALSLSFLVPTSAIPARLIIPIHREGLTGGRVEFPLVVPDAASCTPAHTPGSREPSTLVSSSTTTLTGSTSVAAQGRTDNVEQGEMMPGCS